MQRRSFLLQSLPLASVLASCSRKPGKLRVALAPYFTVSPFYVGLESGYFADAGFDIELITDARSEDTIPLVAAGEVDVMFITASAALYNAVDRGGRLRIVAARQFTSPTCDPIQNVYVRATDFPNGIPDMKPLRGKRIAVRQLFSQFSLDKILEGSGMTRKDVQPVQLGIAESTAALLSGALEAIVSATELSLAAQRLPFTRGPNLGQILPNFQYSHIVFGPGLLDGDVKRGARFVQAYLKGAGEYLRGKTPKFLEDYAKSSGIDPELVRRMCRNTIVADGAIDRKSFEIYAEWAVASKYIEATDPMSVIDDRFLKAITRGDV